MRKKPYSDQAHWGAMAEELAGLGHWRMDLATQEVLFSPGLLAIFSLAPDTKLDIGMVLDRVHPSDRTAFEERKALAMSGAAGASFFRIQRPDGGERFLEGRYGAEFAEDGRVVAIFGTVLDVTERENREIALRDSETRFRLLAEHAHDIIIRVDQDDTILYVSPACRRYGYEPHRLLGTRGYDLVHPEDRPRAAALIAGLFANGHVDPDADRQYRVRTADGSWFWAEGSPSILMDDAGRPTEVISTIRDVTARKATEQALVEARDEAEALAHAKAGFVADMSHELRTPLTSIIGFASLIEENLSAPGPAREYAKRVQSAARSLLAVVNDVLAQSKRAEGERLVTSQPFAPQTLASEVLDLFEVQAREKGLALSLLCTPEAPPVVAADENKLRQVLTNLVANAIKFTDHGGVSVTLWTPRPGWLCYDVTDTGQGISATGLKRLFKRYSQVPKPGAQHPVGWGLGLAISQNLMEAMDGKMGAESRVGKGSSFWIEFPFEPAGVPSPAQPEPGVSPPKGSRVLIVDDNAGNRELTRTLLAAAGLAPSVADAGAAALELAAETQFDAILLDLRMPGMGGREVLKSLRASNGPNHATPVLAFTAEAAPAQRASLQRDGFAGHVSKPLTPANLLAKLAECMPPRATDG